MTQAPLADALAQKAARIERCVARAREELAAAPFALIGERARLDKELVAALQRMVGFRNVALHENDALDLAIAERVIRDELDGLQRFAGLLLQRYLRPA